MRVLPAVLGMTVSLAAAAAMAAPADPMAGADARIEKHRKASVELRLRGPDGRPLPAGTKVRIEQTRHAFLFGCNGFGLDPSRTDERGRAYADRFAALLNYATLGFYWGSYEPAEGRTGEERIRRAAQWCREHGIVAKGHPLVWTIEPRWLKAKPVAEQRELLWGRVDREVRGFAGLIDYWDVLNEACVGVPQGRERGATAVTGLYEELGAREVIRRAFDAATRANPKAFRILNDFNTDRKFEELVRQCLEAGVPIDAIGLQSHMHGGYWGAAKAWDVCERFAKFGKPLHFTELTILSGARKPAGERGTRVTRPDWNSTPEGEARQAKEVVEFYRLLFSHPAVRAITWWDFSDDRAWQGAPAGLVRKDMTPKPAYTELMKLIKGAWWTKTEAETDAQGRVRATGFLGDYRLTAESGGRTASAKFSLTQDMPAKELRLAF